MTRPAADRVKAVWTGVGTGTITIGAAASGEPVQTFPASLDGQVVRYLIKHESALEAESGYGVYTNATTQLTRLYRTYPTPGGAAVSFSSGTKHVSVTPIAIDLVPNIATVDPTTSDDINAGNLMGNSWINTANSSFWVCVKHDAPATWIRITGGAFVLPVQDGGNYSVTPFAVTSVYNAHRFFTGAQNHIIEFPAGLTTDPAAHGKFTAPTANTLTLRRLSGSGVSINGVASDVYTWVVPATGTVEWLVRATNTIELRGDTTAAITVAGAATFAGAVTLGAALNLAAQTINPGAPVDVAGARTYAAADSGKTFRITTAGTQTIPAGLGAGWTVDIWNSSGSDVTIDGPGGTNVTLSGAAAQVGTVKYLSTTVIRVGRADTTLIS